MAAVFREPRRQLNHAGLVLGLAFPLLVAAGPVVAHSPRYDCPTTAGARPMARVEAVERAVQRVEQFLAHVQEGRFERALDHLVENNFDENQSVAIKRLLGTTFRAHHRFYGPYSAFDRIGMQEVGPYVIRTNYLLRTETTSVPITFVLSRVCDDWALEHFDLAGPRVDGKGGSSSPAHRRSV